MFHFLLSFPRIFIPQNHLGGVILGPSPYVLRMHRAFEPQAPFPGCFGFLALPFGFLDGFDLLRFNSFQFLVQIIEPGVSFLHVLDEFAVVIIPKIPAK